LCLTTKKFDMHRARLPTAKNIVAGSNRVFGDAVATALCEDDTCDRRAHRSNAGKRNAQRPATSMLMALPSVTYASCPTAVVNAPLEQVWALLTDPAGWGSFFDVRVTRIEPAGPAVVGQRIYGESGPRSLHLKLELRYVAIDAAHHAIGLNVRLPFGITVREDLRCVPLASHQCSVSYRCDFGFPAGWRGAVARLVLRRRLHAGPADSLARLKRAAERLYARRLDAQ
jgi:Polyketide cyclase / dehydrase and lipid transport